MAIKTADVVKNDDSTWTVRVGPNVEHIDAEHKSKGELFDALKYALISKDVSIDDVELTEMIRHEENKPVEILVGSRKGFVCPDCGRRFSRSQALGIHRSRAHGLPGQHPKSVKERERRRLLREAPPVKEKVVEQPKVEMRPADVEDQMLRLVAPENIEVTLEIIDLLREVEQWVEKGMSLRDQFDKL